MSDSVVWRRAGVLAAAGWAVLAAGVIVGGPLFVRMPPWCDLTLYQVAAANVRDGGVLYRDVFDTNLPGFVLALTAVRSLCGPSVEAVRLVDLAVVTGAVWVLVKWARRAGAGPAGTAWLAAGAAWYYLFTSEFNHAQRDVWMMLPAAFAGYRRVRRLSAREPAGSVWPAFGEGIVWGLAVWVKPHVTVLGLAVWLATVPRMAGVGGVRRVLADAAGLLAGGLLCGAVGVAWLTASGTWPHFVEVFTFWNQKYAEVMWSELADRCRCEFHYFPPWGYLHIVAVPVAVRSIIDGRPWAGRFRPGATHGPAGGLWPGWAWNPGPDDTARFARLVLAALYLAWTAMAILTQRGFHYVHVPEVFLLLAVLATQRWLPAALILAWFAVTTALVKLGTVADETPHPGHVSKNQPYAFAVVHPLAQHDRWRQWLGCFRTGLSGEEYYERWAALALVRDFFPANDWPELGEVADELNRLGAGPRDVVAWHDAPHAVYTLLPARPGFRFQHVTAMMAIGPAHDDRIWTELEELPPAAGGGPKYAVSDLHRVGFQDKSLLPTWEGAGPDLLPPALSARARAMFPHDQPALFRSGGGTGRYVIHKLTRPVRRG